jgi:hypothetical protein
MATALHSAGTGAILLSCRCRMGRWLLMFSYIGDEYARDPRWTAMARLGEPADRPWSTRKVRDRVRALGWSHVLMQCAVAQQRDDGYIGRDEALECCGGELWILEALSTPVRGKSPMLHQSGQSCSGKNCIDASPPWVLGYEFRLCEYLKKNPSKAEKARQDAKKADSSDYRLRAEVYERDGGCCRYCRSGPLKPKGMWRAKDKRRFIQYDHPDPDRDSQGGANLVVSCARCNRDKSDSDILRTPEEADMALLPVPSVDLKAFWNVRGEQQFDRPERGEQSPADNLPDNQADNPLDNQQGVVDPVVTTVVDPVVQSTPHPTSGLQEAAGGPQRQPAELSAARSGSGRVGQPPVGVLGPGGQPVRTADAPDIWTRRSRAPVDPRAGPP